MRILIGMPDPESWGGVQNCEPPFVAALAKLSGVAVQTETYVYGDKKHQTQPQERVRRVLQTAAKFRRLLGENDFDVLHLNTAFDLKAMLRDVATVSLIRNRKIKIFLKFHGSENRLLQTKSSIKKRLWQRLLAQAHGIGVLSSEEKQNFIRAGVPTEKIFTVKNAVQVPSHITVGAMQQAPLRLLFVSRFVPTKGLLETIRAAALLRDQKHAFSLDSLGDGEIRSEAEHLVETLGLKNYVRFHGYVSEAEVKKFYLQSHALVFPTHHEEGFPMVVFNALAHGLPIITTRIRAAADYLSEPENCLWTAPKNPEDTARQIVRLIENFQMRSQMVRHNLTLADNFTAERIAPEYLEIYRRIVNQK